MTGDGYKCACGVAMPSPKYRSAGWECGHCGRYFGLDNLGLWVEVRGPHD